jgi:hypothetical protein
VHIGKLGTGTTVATQQCGLNLYVNGKPASVRCAQTNGIGRAALIFGPELPISNIGAMELYPAGGGIPPEFPREYQAFGLILIWTRPQITMTTTPN